MAGLTTPVIFSIGVVGGAAAKAQFAAIAAGVAILATKVAALVQSADRYSDMMRANVVDMAAYNAATKGLIDTQLGFSAANKFTQAGIKITGEQFAAVGKAAITFADATGITTTEAMNKLTASIVMGSSRSLVKFGIHLDESSNKSLTQSKALQELENRFRGVTVEASNASEKFFQLSNNVGTFSDQMFTSAQTVLSSLPGIGSLNDKLAASTALWELTGGKIYETGNRLAALGLLYDGAVSTITGNDAKLLATAEAWRALKNQMAGTVGKEFQSAADKFLAREKTRAAWQTEEADISDITDYTDMGDVGYDATPYVSPKAARRGGGGGGRKAKVDPLEDLLARSGGREADAGFGEGMDLYEVEVRDQTNQEIWALELELDEKERALAIEKNEWFLQNEVDHREETWQLELESAERSKALEDEKNAWLLQNSRAYRMSMMTETAGSFADMFSNISSLMETESKRAWKIGKAAAYSSAVINGALAAVKAFQSMAGIPIVGVPLGIAAAATVAVATGVQIAKIKDQKFGDSGGGGGSFTGGGSMGASGGGAYTGGLGGGSGYPQSEGAGKSTTINLTLNDEILMTAIIKSNNSASQKGATSLVTQ